MRLAFAVAAHLDASILLVDEVLGVGDAAFQRKCLGKINELSADGRTVLLVSHNMSTVRQLCQKTMLLDKGRLTHFGSTSESINKYLSSHSAESQSIVSHISKRHSDISITKISVNGSADDRLALAHDCSVLEVIVSGHLSRSLRLNLEAALTDLHENRLAFFSPGHDTGHTDVVPPGPFTLAGRIGLPAGMNRGDYYLHLYLTQPNVSGWVDVPYAVLISAEGSPTQAGQTLDYQNGDGWLFLTESVTESLPSSQRRMQHLLSGRDK